MAEPKKINVSLIPETDDKGEIRQPYKILHHFISHFHPHLAEANIALAWRYGWREDADGILRLGQAKKASDLDRELHKFDFIIILNFEAWNAANFTTGQMEALIDHELTHCQIAQDEETGEEKRDAKGRPVWRVRKHDIEEFTEIVHRHGIWTSSLERFAKAAMAKAGEQNLLFKTTVEQVAESDSSFDQNAVETMADSIAKGMSNAGANGDGVSSVTVTLGNTSVTRLVAGDQDNKTPIAFRDAEHAQSAVHVAEDLAALASVNRGAAEHLIDSVVTDEEKAAVMKDALPLDRAAQDELIDAAARFAIERGTITAESLHRNLKIPFKRALTLTHAMEQTHILASENGTLKCKITLEQWEQIRRADAAA